MNTWRHLRSWMLAADLGWAALALMLAVEFRQPGWHTVREQAAIWWPVLIVVLLCWVLLYSGLQLDGFGAGWRRSTVVSQCLLGVGGLMVVVFASGYASHILRSRLALGYFAGIFSFGLITIRLLTLQRVRRSHLAGRTARTLVLGDGRLARETVRRIQRHPELGWTVTGYLSLQQNATLNRAQRELHSLEVIEFARTEKIHQVVIAMDEPLVAEIQKLMEEFRRLGVTVLQVPAQFELYACRPRLLDLDGIPVICFEQTSSALIGRALKRGFDYMGALAVLVVTAPVWCSLAVFSKAFHGRAFVPVRRVGHRGREYSMWKLYWGALDTDHPLCRFGLSELPQLWNVLRGEMSLVGPRPEAPNVVRHYSEWQLRRLDLLPGITGLAQVHGWREKQRERERYSFDLEYIVRWSLWLDVAILLQTVSTLYRRRLRRFPAASPLAASVVPPLAALRKDDPAC